MLIVQLMASPFFGGPERQMLGLARSLPDSYRTVFLTFAERGLSQRLLEEVHRQGLEGFTLSSNYPRLWRAAGEVADYLRELRADVLCCSGYKPDIVGWLAARRAGVPVVAVSHGWTAATWKVRLNEALDRRVLRRMDAVVAVSEGQARKVLAAGVAPERLWTICNAVSADAFAEPDPAYGERLKQFFPRAPRSIVGTIGRLSPEKGMEYLVEAAALIRKTDEDVGFVIFGGGPLKDRLARRIADHGLQDVVVLAGFHNDVSKYLPHLALAVMPSLTEGLPVALLEAYAAGLPVVATDVGGIPEVVEDPLTGYLVPPRDPAALARRIRDVLDDERLRREMGERGKQRVREEFTFEAQSARYQELFASLVRSGPTAEVQSTPLVG